MEKNNIITLLIIIIIFFIIIDYCKNKNKNGVEQFKVNCDIDMNTVPDDTENKINYNICDLRKKRKELVEIIKQPGQKRKNNAQYLNEIKEKINKILEDEKNKREETDRNESEKLATIKKKLIYLNNYIDINAPKKIFNSARSLQNGTKLSIKQIEGQPYYSVKLNNKQSSLSDNTENCLSVKASGNYEIEKCNPNNKQQHFNLQNITNGISYKKNLEKGILNNKKIPENISYPFNLIKSVTNNNCLQNFNNQISVAPCETKKSHRWEPLKEHIYCSRDEK